jgi:hypothetical protein
MVPRVRSASRKEECHQLGRYWSLTVVQARSNGSFVVLFLSNPATFSSCNNSRSVLHQALSSKENKDSQLAFLIFIFGV